MRCVSSRVILSLLAALLAIPGSAQQGVGSQSIPAVPTLVKFGGVLTDRNGKPLTNLVGVTFFLYADAQGGSPLWTETQNVQPDSLGHYTVVLGSTTSQGLPTALFSSAEARWLGVQVQGYAEQPRVLLLSVPYALKAGDAATIGGLPPSAFMLAPPVSGKDASSSAVSRSGAEPNVGGSGSTGYLAGWIDNNGDLGNSVLFQVGSGSSAKVGLNITKPLATLDVNGTAVIRGTLEPITKGVATASKGYASNPLDLEASSFSSSTHKAVMQHFEWEAEPTGNNTNNPEATLNLLFGQDTNVPAETGLKLSNTGVFTFAAGQTFPGTGSGTITGVTAGTDLTGGGNSGSVTLNLDTTKVPQLSSNNAFTGTQQFSGNIGVGTAPSGTSYTPLSVGSANSFGTWFAIANSSSGGHTWNILSAGGGNAEGAGNLGITDLTGKSTIWLEGNTNTANLTASGSAGGAIVDADVYGTNNATLTPGLRFGGGSSGETIASNRNVGLNRYGLDFYSSFSPRVSITQTGQMGIATQVPHNQLDVVSQSNGYAAIYGSGASAASGSGQGGGDGIDVYGGDADLSSGSAAGNGVFGVGGSSGSYGGSGGVFTAGENAQDQTTGPAILTYPAAGGDPTGDGAGLLFGNVVVFGNLTELGGASKIDHPLDPSNKYLYHSFVESSDMMNIYNGNIVTDASGNATVQMPDWFEALNQDFRYQLTVIGQFAQAIVSQEIDGGKFQIRTDKPNVKVSWQVTGIRHDAWANAHRIPVEETKNERERGTYLAPELFGAPEERGFAWAHYPALMRRIKALRERKAVQSGTSEAHSATAP